MLGKLRNAISKMMESAASPFDANHRGYAESLQRMLSDGRLDPSELAALQGQQRSLRLDPAAVRAVHIQAVDSLLRQLLADGVITEAEGAELDQIARFLGVDMSEVGGDIRPLVFRAFCLGQLQVGRLPRLAPNDASILLGPGETAHIKVHAALLHEGKVKRSVTQRGSASHTQIQNGWGSATVRRAGDGFSDKTSWEESEIRIKDAGWLVLTSLRLVFVGRQETADLAWSNMISADIGAGHATFGAKGRKKNVWIQFADGGDARLVEAVVRLIARS